MFKKLTDLSFKRSWLQALGFYLAYFLLALIIGGIFGAIAGALFAKAETIQAGFEAGQRGGVLVATLFPPIVCLMILKSKKMLNNFWYILLALFSGVLGVLGGALLGLIPAAFLSTR